MFDFLIVGAGLFGATAARLLTDTHHKCLVIDKRSHVGGNCYTESREEIITHVYGPHYFHTNDERVWDWMQRFGEWKTYVPQVKALVDDRLYSLPINLNTLNQLWGTITPAEARALIAADQKEAIGLNAEAHLLRTVGRNLYDLFFRGYTTKQWGRPPYDLPRSLVSRLPVRFTYNDSYHTARFQALPIHGYTPIVDAMLDGITVELETDFFKLDWKKRARHLIYTGPLDQLFGYELGKLDYRSLRFENETHNLDDYQGCAQVNYPSIDIPFTRIIEHKHLHGGPAGTTIITKEYPSDEGEPFYPLPTRRNLALSQRYRKFAAADGVFVGGRLGTYRYLDMDGAVASAMQMVDRLTS